MTIVRWWLVVVVCLVNFSDCFAARLVQLDAADVSTASDPERTSAENYDWSTPDYGGGTTRSVLSRFDLPSTAASDVEDSCNHEDVSIVQNFNVQVNSTRVSLTWEPPENECVSEYVIYLDYKEYMRTKYIATDLVLTPCQSYTISITVSYNNQESEKVSKTANIPGHPAYPPKVINTDSHNVFAKLTFELDADMCGSTKLTITCEAKPEHNDLLPKWVKTKATKVQEVRDSQRAQTITTSVKQLSEYTNYTCTAFVTNTAGDSEASPAFLIQTLEGIPSQPQALQVFDVTSGGFKLKWNEPDKVPGVLLKYRIDITNQGPGHEVQDQCRNFTSFSLETEADVYQLVFEEAHPDYKYEIEVFGTTGAGNGAKAVASVTTETSVPEAPQFVQSKQNVIVNSQDQYDVMQTITWNAPCNTNGPLKGFRIAFAEQYVDGTETLTSFADMVNKNNDASLFYTYTVTLDPSYEYHVNISAVLEDDKAGQAALVSFRSPDGYPGPPIVDDIENVTEHSFALSWKAPRIKAGRILRYFITVEPEAHVGLDGRRVDTNEMRIVKEVEPDVFSYRHAARSNSRYKVYVQAETAAGIGPRSEVRTGMTAEGDIDPVQNFKVVTGSFNANLTWEAPANGNFEEYVIYLNDIETARTAELKYEVELDACQKYIIGIAVYYQNQVGEKTTESVDTPQPDKIPYSVEELSASETEAGIHVVWQPPKKIYKCLTGYNINWWDVDTNKVTGNDLTANIEYDIKPLIGCMKYSVMVTPVIGADKVGILNTTQINASQQPTDPPKFIVGTPHKTSVTLTYELEAWTENMCEITQLTITCEAKPENNNLNLKWVIPKATKIEQIEDSQQRKRITTTVEAMSEYTNYTCTATVTNSAGDSAASPDELLQTLEEAPSQPQSLEAFDVTSGRFKLKWTEPEKVPGVMLKYRIRITSQGPKHEVRDACKNTTDVSYEIDAEQYEFEFSEAYPDYEYNIRVYGVDGAGDGDEAATSVVTKTAEPEAPEHLENGKTDVVNTPDEYKAVQTITWDAPCNSNGPLKEFVMEIEERYVEDTDSNTEVKSVEKNDDGFSYSFDVTMNAACEYKVTIKAVLEDGTEGKEAVITFNSPVGYPGKPNLGEIEDVTQNSFTLKWDKPQTRAGEITGYTITIEPTPVNEVVDGCERDTVKKQSVEPGVLNFKYDKAWPYYKYSVHLAAETSAGAGLESDARTGTTQEAEPEQVRNAQSRELYGQTDTYAGISTITFDQPCNFNGPFTGYKVQYTWTKRDQTKNSGPIDIPGLTYDITLLPDYDYTTEVIVKTQNFQSTTEVSTFHSKPGVPKPSTMLPVPKSNSTTQAYFRLSSEAFDQTNGDVLYYALIMMAAKEQHEHLSYGFWDGESWPELPKQTAKAVAPYQATEKFWQPFQLGEKENVSFLFGTDKDCPDKHYCNKPLKEDTKYCLVVRALTRKTYRDSQCLDFRTESLEDDLNLGLILGLIFGLAAAGALIVFIIILWRRKRHILIKEESVRKSSASHGPVGVKKFSAHYAHLQENYSLLKAQFTVLGTSSKELELSTTYAVLPENRRKNRYTNILPFDDTRVKLQIDEDDEICSDYINASYIKGYSGKVEYIATQGPLESTAKDFWKMVLQENVTMIVMVSQFVEQNKEKCFKYFPNNHENMSFGDNLQVRCSTELHFGIYCVRTLQVKKDTVQHTVTHMQFLEWPDFGVPVGTDNMLQFCQQMRERIASEGGLIAVHCSAGVGRTGTLIATDILLQTTEDHSDIDIFKTVLELRKQRINMVQTEKQYMFIHTCIRDSLEMPSMSHDKSNEEIYENLNILKSSAPYEDHHALTESESAL